MADHLAGRHASEEAAKPAARRRPTTSKSGPSSGSSPARESSSVPSSVSGTAKGSAPDSIPCTTSGTKQGAKPGKEPSPVTHSAPDIAPGSVSGSAQGSVPGSGRGSGRATRSGSVTRRGSSDCPDPQNEGYGVVTAGVFLTSASVGANLLNVPQTMAHLGWMGLPVIAVLCLQTCFCSHLLASSWMMVQSLDQELAGAVHRPYPLMVGRALGPWASCLTSLTVLGVDTLSSVMLLVLASDLVGSIVSYAFPPAQPTVCLLILLLATFLCPFTWFESPKNFWMVAVLGLSTSASAWLLLLMKMCADYCQRRSPPVRVPPSPLRMLVGIGSISNSYVTGGVQPTIQVDMRDRSAFSSSLVAVFLAITVIISSTAATSYTLIGSDTKSSVLHSLGPGRLLLAIQVLMLLHVLTSFIIYINPLYQEMEEMLAIPEGTWRQYTFRTFCMCLMVLISEALPDFGNILDLLSVLAIIITMVVPPILYLRLASRPEVDLELNRAEKTFLVFLAVTGLVFGVAVAIGATSFVFVEQQQGSCFQYMSPAKRPSLTTAPSTTPASRAIIFKAQILTFKPPTA